MTRHLAVAALLLTLSACSKNQGLKTIEDAESFAKARGVTLAEKKEDTQQIVSPRAFDYITGSDVKLGINQFNSADAAAKFKKAMDDMPLGREVFVHNGHIVFIVWGGSDVEKQKIVTALQHP
ncbi:hypothetical protein F0U59_23410 [Archangium gephyra]|nr:hypothetical protein F0U59_23410 [Archangium gephyra]